MMYPTMCNRALVGAKLALSIAVIAGFMAFSGLGHAATVIDLDGNGPTTDSVAVGLFGSGDVLLSNRIWDDGFAGDSLLITYFFTADGDVPTFSTATALNPNPTTQGDFGIANLVLSWFDSADNPLNSQQFTDANGVLDTSAILSQLFADGQNFTLKLTGTLLGEGGGYQLRVEAIPLPAGLLLFLSGLGGIGVLGRYKARRRVPATA